jgi:hypothetical protein
MANRLGHRMVRLRPGMGGDFQELLPVQAVASHHLGDAKIALGEGAGFVENHGCHLGQRI